MTVNTLKHRLLALESKSCSRDVILHFADGSTRSVRIKDTLGCLISAWRRKYAMIVGDDMPHSPYDDVLDLFARCERLDPDSDPLLFLAKESAEQWNGEV